MKTKISLRSNRILLSVFDSLPCSYSDINKCYQDVIRKAEKIALIELHDFYDNAKTLQLNYYIDYKSTKFLVQWPVKDEGVSYSMYGYLRSLDDDDFFKFRISVILS